jgi:hypothetical protein
MDDVQPLWRSSLAAARRSAFAALPECEQEAAKAASEERRARSSARKRVMRDLARRIFTMADDGATAEEIGAAVDRSPRAVRALAAQRGVLVSRSCMTVRYAITVTIDRCEALRRLATDYKASPSETLEDLLTFALDEDAAIARRTLRVVRPAH